MAQRGLAEIANYLADYLKKCMLHANFMFLFVMLNFDENIVVRPKKQVIVLL